MYKCSKPDKFYETLNSIRTLINNLQPFNFIYTQSYLIWLEFTIFRKIPMLNVSADVI